MAEQPIDLTQTPVPDDTPVVRMWSQELALVAVLNAVDIGLFNELSRTVPATAATLAPRLKVPTEALERVCRVLCSLDVLLSTPGGYILTDQSAAFWVATSPLYRGAGFVAQRESTSCRRIKQMFDEGWSPIQSDGRTYTDMWAKGDITPGAARGFTGAMFSMIIAPSLAIVRSGPFAEVKHLVDVGGGSGAFAIALTLHQPKTRTTIMDLAPVCEVAKEYVHRFAPAAAERIDYLPMNFMTDPWPRDSQAFLFSNILHDWPIDICRQLLQSASDALRPGGEALVLESLLDESKTAPFEAVIFDLMMYMSHRSQQFTRNELLQLLQEAGFDQPTHPARYGIYTLTRARKS